jgi:lipoprotein-anchoring transpeptidase ErfK/SrfK
MKLFAVLAVAGVTSAVAASVVGLPLSSAPKAVAVETAPAAPTTTTTPAVTAPPATAPTTVPVGGGLVPGAAGADVLALQQRLVQLHYDPGTVDGHYGADTALAVMAFQKVSGLNRTGVANTETRLALAAATDPAPLVPAGAPTRVEVDIARQVLFVWSDGQLVKILPVSTGSGQRYCEHGECGVAVTPVGEFRAERRIPGLHRSPLGVLYNPVFFHQGFAIHGSPSIPPYPASHGCVRVPIPASRWIYDNIPDGTPIHLV